MKKILLISASVLLIAALAVGMTIAYLTDRESITNVFTLGDVTIDLTEDFEQGATLTPGVNITKIPTITNVGKNDAWVWLTFSIPTALDNWNPTGDAGSNENIIHWNPLGATAEGYVTQARVDKAIADGYLPTGTTADDIINNKQTWNVFNDFVDNGNAYRETIHGVEYNTYVLPYNKAIVPGEETLPCLYNVFMDARIDIDPNGDLYRVVNGVATKIDWNVTEDGAPVAYVAAYGVQKENFANVKEAFSAYVGQWGKLNAAFDDPKTLVVFKEDLSLGGELYLAKDIDVGATAAVITKDSVINLNGHKISAAIPYTPNKTVEDITTVVVRGANVTFQGEGTIINDDPESAYALAVYDGATVTIGEGTYISGHDALYVKEGTLIVEGGFFEATLDDVADNDHTSSTGEKCFTTTVINCYDDTYLSGDAVVIVKGGTFVNMDPSSAHEGKLHCRNFVAAGYKVVAEPQANGDIWYTVVAE